MVSTLDRISSSQISIWQNEPNSVRANPVWALGSIAPIAKSKPTKLRRKRMDHRFGKLLLVVSIVDFYLMETARPIWQNEAKNRINIRRPIPAEVVPDAQEFGRLDQQPFRRSQFFWQNEPNSGFGLRADYALILLCTTSNLGCRIIAGSAGDNAPKWNTS